MSGIVVENLSMHYGRDPASPPVIRDIGFDIPRGTLATLLGPSGCGKTTLLRLIAGLETPTAGRIRIDGRDVTGLGPAQRNLSLMFQSYALFPHLDVAGNVMYGLRRAGLSPAQARPRALALLEQVGLQGLQARFPDELSGGQQQRVALARALVLEPSVLLFDEPLSNLDTRLRRAMREEIRALQQRLQLTVVYVTHDQTEALAVSDQIIVLDGGRIAQRGTPAELYENPATAFVAGFMGEALLLPGTLDAQGEVRLGPLRLQARRPLPAGAVQVLVRPQAWVIGEPGSGLPARLLRRTYLGSHFEYSFETSFGPVLVVCADLARPLDPGVERGLSLSDPKVSVVTVS